MIHDMLYNPSEWGKLFHSLKHNEALGAGAAGPGKSMVLLFDPFEQLTLEHNRCVNKKHPYHIDWGMSDAWALHLRRESVMLNQTLERAARFFPKIDPDVRFVKDESTYYFKCGMKYTFGHCKDTTDWQKYLSNQYTHIGFDELTQFESEQYHQIGARLRSGDPLLSQMLKRRAMSNPFASKEGVATVTDPHWVRKYFVDPCPTGKKTLVKNLVRGDGSKFRRTRIYLPATLYDNPDPTFVRQYEEELLDKPGHIRQAMLYGDWYVNPGSFYGDEWNRQIHVIRPFRIPRDWRIVRAMDWGFKTHGVIVWAAIDHEGTAYIFRELSFKMKSAKEVALRVKEIETGLGLWNRTDNMSMVPGCADTQLWEERGDEVGRNKAKDFAEIGVGWQRADKKSRAKNAERLLIRLKDHRNYSTIPKIVFFENCVDCIRTIPTLQTDPHYPEQPLEGGDDHWHDAVVYLCAFISNDDVGVSVDQAEEMENEPNEDPEVVVDGYPFGYGTRV